MEEADRMVRPGVVWQRWLGRAPLGVLVLGMVLALLGAGFMAAGAYLGLTRPAAGWPIWLGAVLIGPLILYVRLRVIALAPWAWLTMLVLTLLLLASSSVRAAVTPSIPIAPLGEILLELGVIGYLLTPRVRAAFRRGPESPAPSGIRALTGLGRNAGVQRPATDRHDPARNQHQREQSAHQTQ